MSLDSVVFLSQYPKLDLHGYDRESARVAICDFLKEQYFLKQQIVVIVHGIGSGILKATTDQVLSHHKLVQDYKTFYHNQGCTVVLLIH